MLSAHSGSLILLVLTSLWSGSCRHTARSKAKSFVRMEKSLLESGAWVNKIPPAANGFVNICSFNIKVLGQYQERQKLEAKLMAQALAPCALVVVQEITAPPIDLEFPNGESMEADPESKIIFDALTHKDIGFSYILSPEDTGRWINNSPSDASEFFAFFYKPKLVKPIELSANGFLQSKLRGSRDCAKELVEENTYDRVPFAQGFRFTEGNSDVIVINTHLHSLSRKPCTEATESTTDAIQRRGQELKEIFLWTEAYRKELPEADFLVMGDMNLSQAETELINSGEVSEENTQLRSDYYEDLRQSFLKVNQLGYRSLNESCIPTNTSARACLDHVLVNPKLSKSVAEDASLGVLNLKGFVRASGYCESRPSVCLETESTFSRYFSDHNPVYFTWKLGEAND